MKLDIENKILIPFVILVILPIIILGIVSYLGGYEILMDNENKNLRIRLDDSIEFIHLHNRYLYDRSINDETKKNEVINYFKEKNYNGMFILENKEIIFDTIESKKDFSMELMKKILDQRRGLIKTKDGFITFENYDAWDWIIGYKVVRKSFTQDLLDIQKYTILVAIIFSIFSVQATIFISHNISKPIKTLADNCNTISIGNFKKRIDINRKDEIGILAKSFNNMINKLQNSTDNLLEMKKFNENILRNISTGIITTNEKGDIVSINEAAIKILEYKSVNQLENGKLMNEILKEQLKNTLINEISINKMYTFNGIGNEKLYFDVTTSLLVDEDKNISGAICSINDITKRKKIESRIERINRLTSLGQLAAGLAHEIRNPLAGMKTSIQVLKNRFKETSTTSSKQLFDSTLYEIDRLNSLISELLDLAKPHYPKYENTNIVCILNKSIDLVKKGIDEKKINTDISIEDEDCIAFIDKAQIEQVFLNIITNSIKAVGQHGMLKIIISNVSNEKGDFIIIKFKDNGCGIKEEDVDKIFDPFYTTEPQGTGLGLSVVHKLVTENNGEIEVESAVDIGTEFIIRLPMGRSEANEEKGFNN